MSRLPELRRGIDAIDEELLKLLNKRAFLACEIGREKKKAATPVIDKEREQEVLDRIKSLNGGPLCGDDVERIYERIISICAEVQQRD